MASSYQLEKIYSSEIRSGRSAVTVTVSRFNWPDEEGPRPFDARVTIEHTTAIGSANALIRLTREQLREAAEVLTAAADAWDARHARPVLAATPCACGARRYEGAEKCAACVAFDRQYPNHPAFSPCDLCGQVRPARALTPRKHVQTGRLSNICHDCKEARAAASRAIRPACYCERDPAAFHRVTKVCGPCLDAQAEAMAPRPCHGKHEPGLFAVHCCQSCGFIEPAPVCAAPACEERGIVLDPAGTDARFCDEHDPNEWDPAPATPPTLTADEGAHGWTVVDSDGGRWFPGREAIDAIDGAPDPGARAVAICDETPMAGEWSA